MPATRADGRTFAPGQLGYTDAEDRNCGAFVAIACVLLTATGWPIVWVLQAVAWLRGVA